jgi:hypothetical protein
MPRWFVKLFELLYDMKQMTSTYYCKIHCTDLECCVSVLGQGMYVHLRYIQAVGKMLQG